jgi:hypothetical protein
MNFAILFKAFDTVVALRDAAKRLSGAPVAADAGLTTTSGGIAGHIEARLTNVVVAALKEAFDRDHARLELERAQLDEQRRRAEAAMRMELRRQAAERELSRLRLVAATAFAGWVASVFMLVVRLGSASPISRYVLAAGWLLLLGGLGAAFTAQQRSATFNPEEDRSFDAGPAGAAALWLVLAGLAVSATSLLF